MAQGQSLNSIEMLIFEFALYDVIIHNYHTNNYLAISCLAQGHLYHEQE